MEAIKNGGPNIGPQESPSDILADTAEENKSLFLLKSANKWMEIAATMPDPKRLFDAFWNEGELCILFADTGAGKSLLAVQIGVGIASGKARLLEMDAQPPQPVLYFDFEMGPKQFENRYKDGNGFTFTFPEDFYRVEINPDGEIPAGANEEAHYFKELERAIADSGARVVIVDNITYLDLRNGNEKAREALPLMKYLKRLKKRHGLSILALAHTPKRDQHKPISQNDLQGSKMLINFCDAAFAIGQSCREEGIRYLRQVKQRQCAQRYGVGNVVLCQIEKLGGFTGFTKKGFGDENEHLRERKKKDVERMIVDLKKRCPNISDRKIAERLGTYPMEVGRVLKEHRDELPAPDFDPAQIESQAAMDLNEEEDETG